jgi:hypothetical protein
MVCKTWGGIIAIGPRHGHSLLQLCISDRNKDMLIACPGFVPHMISSLMLDPNHGRKGIAQKIKHEVQRDYAECIQQISLVPAGCEALRANPAVVEALDALAEHGWTDQARQSASATLFELCPERINTMHSEQIGGRDGPGAKHGHVMISYQWDAQITILRLVNSLEQRKYAVWFDLNNMNGNIMDAMAEAVDEADVVLYCVSPLYKESANCRLEANYAHQKKKTMIPIMVQKNYSANGWLGLLLGTALWYPLYDLQDADDAVFQAKVDPIVKAVGDRGKIESRVQEAVTTAPTPAFQPTPEPTPTLVPATSNRTGSGSAPSAPTPECFTPTMQNLTSPMALEQQQHSMATSSASLSELTAIFRELREISREQHDDAKADRMAMEAKMERQRAVAQAERAEMQARMEARIEQQRVELTPPPPQPAITDTQLATLLMRFEGLHAAKLLSDEELYALEDLVADWAEIQASMVEQVVTEVMLYAAAGDAFGSGTIVHKLIKISAVIPSDPGFARQVRRRLPHPVAHTGTKRAATNVQL